MPWKWNMSLPKLMKAAKNNEIEANRPFNGLNFIMKPLQSLWNKYTESGATGRDVAVNNMQLQNLVDSPQKIVEGYQNAGLNPALMYGSAPSPASTPVSGTTSNGLSDLLAAFSLPMQLKQMKANVENVRSQTEVNEAQAGNIKEQTRNTKLNADFLETTYDVRVRSAQLSNDMTNAQIRSIYKNMDKLDNEIELLIKQSATEEERKTLTYWQGKLAQANAEQIAALLPYEIEFKQAATKAQKAAAAASMIHAAYEKGLIDSGYIDALTQEVKARAHATEEKATADAFANSLRTGHLSEFIENNGGVASIPDGLFMALNLVTSTIGNVFGGLFK